MTHYVINPCAASCKTLHVLPSSKCVQRSATFCRFHVYWTRVHKSSGAVCPTTTQGSGMVPICEHASQTGALHNRARFWSAEDGMPSKQLLLCAVRRDQASLTAKHPRHCVAGSGCTKHGIPGLQGLYHKKSGVTLVCYAPYTYPCTFQKSKARMPIASNLDAPERARAKYIHALATSRWWPMLRRKPKAQLGDKR